MHAARMGCTMGLGRCVGVQRTFNLSRGIGLPLVVWLAVFICMPCLWFWLVSAFLLLHQVKCLFNLSEFVDPVLFQVRYLHSVSSMAKPSGGLGGNAGMRITSALKHLWGCRRRPRCPVPDVGHRRFIFGAPIGVPPLAIFPLNKEARNQVARKFFSRRTMPVTSPAVSGSAILMRDVGEIHQHCCLNHMSSKCAEAGKSCYCKTRYRPRRA